MVGHDTVGEAAWCEASWAYGHCSLDPELLWGRGVSAPSLSWVSAPSPSCSTNLASMHMCHFTLTSIDCIACYIMRQDNSLLSAYVYMYVQKLPILLVYCGTTKICDHCDCLIGVHLVWPLAPTSGPRLLVGRKVGSSNYCQFHTLCNRHRGHLLETSYEHHRMKSVAHLPCSTQNNVLGACRQNLVD